MATPGAESDESMLSGLRAIAAAADPMPDHVHELARAALATRNLDELARLLTASEEPTGVLTRDEGESTRLLSFASQAVAIELQVGTERSAAIRVRGLLRGTPGPVTVEERGGATREVPVDDTGFFTLAAASPTLLRLRVPGTTTEWFEV